MTRITLLGVGRMGHELARHLLDAGHHLSVWNRTPSGADAIVALGAQRATSPAEAIDGAEVVMTALFGPDAVQAVVVDAALLAEGALWLDVTTISPEQARGFAHWAEQHGVRYVHAPVVGSLGPARARKLGSYLGGAAADVAALRPIAALWTDPDRLVELPDAAAAATGKLIANLALGVSLQGLTEALRLGRSNGIGEAAVLDMLRSTGLDFIAAMKGPVIREGSYERTQFSVDLLAKDARLMLASSDEPLPAVTALLETLEEAVRQGRGGLDIAAATLGDR